MKQIAWIGTGVMGGQQAGHLAKNGYPVKAYNRSQDKLEALKEEFGLTPCETIAQAVDGADVVFVMVGYPKDVEEVFLGKGGIFENAKEGALLIDMTTSSPSLAQRLYEEGKKKGLRVMDAPVSGGDSGARNGTLSIMVGGEQADFDACLPLFRAMGKSILYEGPAGFGQHTKMANQIAIAGAVSGVCEALSYAEHMGLDTRKMLDSISQGAAGSWQMSNVCPKMMAEDYAPGFFLKHFIKDMTIAASQGAGELPVLRQVLSEYQELEAAGEGDLGTQALIRWYRKD